MKIKFTFSFELEEHLTDVDVDELHDELAYLPLNVELEYEVKHED